MALQITGFIKSVNIFAQRTKNHDTYLDLANRSKSIRFRVPILNTL